MPQSNFTSHNWESFLNSLSSIISKATPDYPSTRCWSRKSLATIVQKIKRERKLPSTFPNTPEILTHLKNIGWAYKLDVDPLSNKTPPSKDFYLLDITAAHEIKIDPLELMQAYKPKGIICYMSALTYHSLTSQLPTQHHIAVLVKPTKTYESPKTIRKENKKTFTDKKSSLGDLVFNFQNQPCYLTRRSQSRLVGYQTRITGPRTRLRLTTIEQCLLDTLHKPICCGGVPVVLEAWQEGLPRIDEELLTSYLLQINYPLYFRRLGALFELLDYTPGGDLEKTIALGLESFDQNDPNASIALLPGFNFPTLNKKWQVLTP